MRRRLSLLVALFALALPGLALASQGVAVEPAHAEVGLEPAHAAGPSVEHGAAHGDEHAPSFDDFNWYYGLISEKEGVEPSLLFRPKGMPVPFAALLLDSAILYLLLYKTLGKPVRDGLRKRKEGILRGMEEAAKMKREAEGQLAFYEEKLAKIDQDVLELRAQMRHAAESESARILSEAKERRVRMERDAHQLVEQELKAMREQLSAETVQSALRSAEAALVKRITEADQQRFGDEYLSGLAKSAASLRGRL